MLVQARHDRLRLITQHHHGLLSGRLAWQWRGVGSNRAALPFELQLAVTLHDVAWESVDRQARYNGDTQRPYEFVDHPLEDKDVFYREGLDWIERIEPCAGLLCSMHYTTFIGTDTLEAFQAGERDRRKRLKAQLALSAQDDDRLDAQLHFLKMFDNFSLFLCLMGPSAVEKERFPWLNPDFFATTPQGESFQLRWVNDQTVTVDPFPFAEPFDVCVPYRDLPAKSFANDKALQDAWKAAPTETMQFRLRPIDS